MTDYYCDISSGNDSNDGSTWALAKLTSLAGVNLMTTDGDRLFIKGTLDTYAVNLTWLGIINSDDVHFVVGCKSGTTNEPPDDSDICVRGTDTLPRIQVTGSSNFYIDGSFTIYGLSLESSNNLYLSQADSVVEYEDCTFLSDSQFIIAQGADSAGRYKNCEWVPEDATSGMVGTQASPFSVEIIGGIWNGDSNPMESQSFNALVMALDMEAVAREINAVNFQRHNMRVFGCGMHASGGLQASANTRDWIGQDALIACVSSDPAAGSSVRDYQGANVAGTTLDETTIIRTGGADDGVAGGWAYALTPFANRTVESANSIYTPWMSVWIDGDNSTEFTLSVYIANDDSGDLNTDEVWIDWITPPTVASRTWAYSTTRQKVSGGTTAVADDTGSTWGAGGNNHQKFEKTFTPRFAGPCMAKVYFAKRYASAPKTCYVDAMIHVA